MPDKLLASELESRTPVVLKPQIQKSFQIKKISRRNRYMHYFEGMSEIQDAITCK